MKRFSRIADNVKDKTQKAFYSLLSGVTKKDMVWPFIKMFVDDLKSVSRPFLPHFKAIANQRVPDYQDAQ